MCKACQAYRKEFTVFQDQKQGALPAHYGEDEVNYKPAKKVKKVKTRAGCPGNDNKEHVYVWTTEGQMEDLFFMYFGYHKEEVKRCCGCNKVYPGNRYRNSRRKTERYVKRWKPVGRYDAPERKHPGYAEFRRKWLVQHGFTREYYGF
jgi:hypothetical protein